MALTPEQVAERIHYLGGTDAAAVLGMSRYKTALDVWAEKTGAIKPEDISDRLPIRVGVELEALVGKLFSEETGKKLTPAAETLTHKKHKFLRANLDFRVVDEKAFLEAKTASGWKAKEWETDQVPPEYMIQCLHDMAVSGDAYCYLACLIGGNQEFTWIRIDRDEKLIKQIIDKEVEFWTKYVVPKVMPKIMAPSDTETLFKLFPSGIIDEEPLVLGDEANRLADSIMAMVSDKKTLDGVIDKEKNQLRAMLGKKAVARTDRYSITWKNQSATRFDIGKARAEIYDTVTQYSKTSESRVLRISELKKSGGNGKNGKQKGGGHKRNR